LKPQIKRLNPAADRERGNRESTMHATPKYANSHHLITDNMKVKTDNMVVAEYTSRIKGSFLPSKSLIALGDILPGGGNHHKL